MRGGIHRATRDRGGGGAQGDRRDDQVRENPAMRFLMSLAGSVRTRGEHETVYRRSSRSATGMDPEKITRGRRAIREKVSELGGRVGPRRYRLALDDGAPAERLVRGGREPRATVAQRERVRGKRPGGSPPKPNTNGNSRRAGYRVERHRTVRYG